MQYEYTRRRSVRSPVTDAPTFRVGRVAMAGLPTGTTGDLTHLIDRSYNYHSRRELRWHLAERLGVMPGEVSLCEATQA